MRMSDSFKQHLINLEDILKRFQSSKITIKFNKSSFRRTEIPFLGIKVTTHGIAVKEEKIEAILKYLPPKCHKQLQVFIRLANFYK